MTTADSLLIAHARQEGQEVTERQLKRWRAERLLPHRTIHGKGRGRGVVGADPPGLGPQVVAVSRALASDRNVHRAALRLWYAGWEIPTELVRRQLTTALTAQQRLHQGLACAAPEAGTSGMMGFDVAELDTKGRPVTREERHRMEDAAMREKERAHQLVHAVRSATEGQLFSPRDEISAIPEELAKDYFGFTAVERQMASAGFPITSAFEEWEAIICGLSPESYFTVPTEAELLKARKLLRDYFDASIRVGEHAGRTGDEGLSSIGYALRALLAGFDPRGGDYEPDALLTALHAASVLTG